MEPRARNTDPGTSHAAAAKVAPMVTTVRSRVLGILTAAPEARDGLTHDQLIVLYRKYATRLGWPMASDSSIRTRCNELVRDGEVEKVPDGDGRSRFGNAALLWRAVPVQKAGTPVDNFVDGGDN